MQTSRPSTSTQWTGILRLALPSLLWILVFSIVTLGLASSWGSSVAQDKENNLSTTGLVFYCGTIPLLAILSTLLTLAFHLTSRLTFTTALAISTTLCVGWIIQASIWTDCEFIGPGNRETVSDYCPGTGPNGTGVGKVSIAWAVITGYLVHLGLAAYGIAETKKAAKQGVFVKQIGEDREELKTTYP